MNNFKMKNEEEKRKELSVYNTYHHIRGMLTVIDESKLNKENHYFFYNTLGKMLDNYFLYDFKEELSLFNSNIMGVLWSAINTTIGRFKTNEYNIDEFNKKLNVIISNFKEKLSK